MVGVGVNDFWIAPAPVSEEDGGGVRFTDALWLDLHPTLKGHQLAARMIASRLRDDLRSP